MADPAAAFSDRQSDPNGVGPYTFEVPALAAGESWRLDLRNYNRGQYVTLSPAGYDSLQVTNETTGIPVTVAINDAQTGRVAAGTIETQSMSGMYVFDVTNQHATDSTVAGDIVLEVLKEPLGADEMARREAQSGPFGKVVEHFTGVNPFNG